MLALIQFPFFLKFWTYLVYLVPFLCYCVLYVIMWPFMQCCRCARVCMGTEKKKPRTDEDIGDSVSHKEGVDLEGGEEVVYEGGDDDNNLQTDRNLNVRGMYDRADRYRETEENKYLETSEAMTGNNSKKGKRGRKDKKSKSKEKTKKAKGKSKSPAKNADTTTAKPKKERKEKKHKDLARRDTREMEDLGFFSRIVRSLQPKYCAD